MIRLYDLIKRNTKLFLFYPLWFYWILLFTLTSLPSTSFADALRFSDKIKHFGAYLVLSLLLNLSLHFQNKWKKVKDKYLIFGVLGITVYGALDEIHQMFIPNRSAELLDWFADIGGAVLGAIIIYYFVKYSVEYAKKGTI